MTAIQILMNKLHKSVHPATNLLTAPPSPTCLWPLFSHPSHPGYEPTEQTFSKRSPTLSSFLSHASAPVEPPACPLTVHSFTQRHLCSPRSPALLTPSPCPEFNNAPWPPRTNPNSSAGPRGASHPSALDLRGLCPTRGLAHGWFPLSTTVTPFLRTRLAVPELAVMVSCFTGVRVKMRPGKVQNKLRIQ